MSDPVTRLPEASASAVSTVSSASESPQGEASSTDSFLSLVINHPPDFRSVESSGLALKGLSATPLDRLARERVFDSIVRKTLDNPEHPYYSLLGAETRKEMIQKITTVLNSSHYLNPSKRQA